MSTETEIELGKVVVFPSKNNDLQDVLVIQREGQKVMCCLLYTSPSPRDTR